MVSSRDDLLIQFFIFIGNFMVSSINTNLAFYVNSPTGRELDRQSGTERLNIKFDVDKEGMHQACVSNNDNKDAKF